VRQPNGVETVEADAVFCGFHGQFVMNLWWRVSTEAKNDHFLQDN